MTPAGSVGRLCESGPFARAVVGNCETDRRHCSPAAQSGGRGFSIEDRKWRGTYEPDDESVIVGHNDDKSNGQPHFALLYLRPEMMNPTEALRAGMTGRETTIVTRELTVAHFHPTMPEVYGTPFMIYLLEVAASNAIKGHLPEGWASVGYEVHVKHLAPTPVGRTVTATARLYSIDGRFVKFTVEAHDGVAKIGQGTHVRALIELSRFKKKLARRKPASPANRTTATAPLCVLRALYGFQTLFRRPAKPQSVQRGLASLSRDQRKRRATTDHTDSTDKKADEDWQIALNPPHGFASAPMAEWRNGGMNPLPWSLSRLFISVIAAAFVRGLKPLIRGSHSLRAQRTQSKSVARPSLPEFVPRYEAAICESESR